MNATDEQAAYLGRFGWESITRSWATQPQWKRRFGASEIVCNLETALEITERDLEPRGADHERGACV